MLTDKIAVVYGAAGPIGAAMASGFARNGARVHLAGRTESTLRAVADSIPGGAATPHVVDALDRAVVDDFVQQVLAVEGRIDISANVIGVGDIQRPLLELEPDDFVQPIATRFAGWWSAGVLEAGAAGVLGTDLGGDGCGRGSGRCVDRDGAAVGS